MPFRDDQNDTAYFARLDRERLALRYPSDLEGDIDDPEEDDEEDDSDIGGEAFIDDSADYEPDYFDQIED